MTKDGVTVSKEIELLEPFQNMGAKLVNEVASKTSDVAGDGTTTATILAEAIFAEGLKNVTAGANPMALKRGIDAAVEIVVKSIASQSAKVGGKGDIAKVASISANGDEAVGKMLSEAFDKVGKDGVVEIEEGKGMETTWEHVEGMQFDKGFLFAVLHHQPGFARGGARRPVHPDLREENQLAARLGAAAREDRQRRQAVPDYRPRISRAKRWRCWSSISFAAC